MHGKNKWRKNNLDAVDQTKILTQVLTMKRLQLIDS